MKQWADTDKHAITTKGEYTYIVEFAQRHGEKTYRQTKFKTKKKTPTREGWGPMGNPGVPTLFWAVGGRVLAFDLGWIFALGWILEDFPKLCIF